MTGTAEAESTLPGANQTYLVGESLYIRAPELADAKWASAWRASPFPISAQLLEEQLKKELPEELGHRKWRGIACRRDDGRPVGSATVADRDGSVSSWISLYSDPTLAGRGAEVQAEMLDLLVSWLSGERNRPLVGLSTDIDLEPVVAAAERLGMRQAVRLRDGIWRDGRLRDLVFYEYFHPAWVALFGDPGSGVESAGAPLSAPRVPALRRDPALAPSLPANSVIGSERLALRPLQVEDAAPIAELFQAEPDASFGEYRLPYSPIVIAEWFGELGKNDPAKDVEFAIVLRDTGEIIGENGLYQIDWLARNAESGTWIYRPEYRGGGYGTEAKHLLLEYAFERLGLHMIWSWVKSRNARSQAALRKQGYRDAGRFSWTTFGPEGFDDARMFDLLASEWRSARDSS